MLATEYAKHYKIDPQGENETDHQFKYRVAGELRKQGKLIEAHEAFQNERYENSENVMTGMMGAIAFAMEDRGFHGDPVTPDDGEKQIDDDFAAGTIIKHKRKEPEITPELALMMVELFGRR